MFRGTAPPSQAVPASALTPWHLASDLRVVHTHALHDFLGARRGTEDWLEDRLTTRHVPDH